MALLSPSLTFSLYVGWFALAAVGCFGSVTRLQRISDADTRRGLLALLLTSGGWATAHVGFLVSPARQLKLGWYVLGLILGLAAVGAWLYFCSAYTNRTYHRNPTYRRLAIGVFVVLVAVKVTNPLHHGYFTATTVATPFPHLSVSTGPLHWTAMGLSYALAFVGYFMLLELFTAIDLDTRPLVLLVGISGLPVVADLVGYTMPILVDITYEPLGVAVFAIGVVFVYLDRFEAVQLATERNVPVLVLDTDGHIRDTNRAARHLFPDLDTVRDAPLDAVLPSVAECLDSENPILKIRYNGGNRYFRITETPYGTAKRGLGSTLTFTDVTEREQYRHELERQNERLDRFASLVSHDMRNPLNVAQGRFDLVRKDLDPSDDNVAAIERALTRMETLIDEMLTLARNGQQVEQWDAVRLSTFVSDCWAMVETGEAKITVTSDLTFEANPDRLKRLFENLFRNAIEHGGTDVTVTVGALDDEAGFFVADDGPGIPGTERNNVFGAGYTTSETGTGFGLAIVDDIAAAHGWEIRIIESAAGGARFEVVDVDIVE
ncbi:sensor histidine kinase [Halosimplex salinum]|uniref:sensor histidine kinase n=1 Tax=Halosimplex salinum TaxID=1710538 RepID=UPI000F485E60|nr:ATP-binding protein [Halosimplex salinum]